MVIIFFIPMEKSKIKPNGKTYNDEYYHSSLSYQGDK